MAIERFEQLEVWQAAHQLVLDVYETTRKLPRDQKFGLIAQMQRAAVSVQLTLQRVSNGGGVAIRFTFTTWRRAPWRNCVTTSFSAGTLGTKSNMNR